MPTAEAHIVKRILWIDDQISGFGAHIDELGDNDYDVTQVETADQALAALEAGVEFDAILVDLKLAESDGITLLDKLYKWLGVNKTTKLIVVSSFLYEPTIRRRLVEANMRVQL